jgi:hypothetical protein
VTVTISVTVTNHHFGDRHQNFLFPLVTITMSPVTARHHFGDRHQKYSLLLW